MSEREVIKKHLRIAVEKRTQQDRRAMMPLEVVDLVLDEFERWNEEGPPWIEEEWADPPGTEPEPPEPDHGEEEDDDGGE